MAFYDSTHTQFQEEDSIQQVVTGILGTALSIKQGKKWISTTNLSHVLSPLKRLRFYFDHFDIFEENPSKFLLKGSLKIKKNSQIFVNLTSTLF